jgi:hypothetical protein
MPAKTPPCSCCLSYSYEQTTIEGFSFTHLSGIGWYGDFGNLQVMPTMGPASIPDTDLSGNTKPGASAALFITLTNPDAKAAKLTAPFTDNLPSGMVVYGLPSTVPDNICGGTLNASKGSADVTLTGGQIPADGTCEIIVLVSVQKAGTYINSLHVGILKTGNGSNANQANATLIVSASAGAGTQLFKSFSPATIKNDGISTLTITLKNPYALTAKLEAPLVDNMPKGMVVVSGWTSHLVSREA